VLFPLARHRVDKLDLNFDSNQRDNYLFIIQIILSLVQLLSLIFLGVYVWKTWQMASYTKNSVSTSEKMIEEMKKTRDLETAPYVIPFININHHMMYFGIKNIGKTVAKNITLQIEPELKSHILGDKAGNLPLIKNGISSLPPGHEIGTLFDVSHRYLNETDSPKKYFVRIMFIGGLSEEQREYEQILDLSVYYDLIPNEDKRLSDIVNELQNLSKHSQKISDNLEKINDNFSNGIWIKNPEIFMACGQSEIDSKSSGYILISKLNELKTLLSWILKESDDFPPCDAQVRMNYLASQLLVIASNYSMNSNLKIKENTISLALSIFALSGSMSFIVGRKLDGFNEEIIKHSNVTDELTNLMITQIEEDI
jgi:hypothetical protein